MRVRAMFRVLEAGRTYDGTINVRAAPTHGSRDGKPVEENRSYWQATPSGNLALALPDDSNLLAIVGEPGAYFYMDVSDPGDDAVGVPTEWAIRRLTFIAGGGFEVSLAPEYTKNNPDRTPRNENGNAGAWRRRYANGELAMTINNLGALPGFAFEAGAERAKVIGFSPA